MDDLDKALSLDVRSKIYRLIDRNPGLHFREIQRRTNFAVGSLQYHLEYLQKKHLVKIEKDGKFVRYYSVRGPQLGEATKTMALLRQKSVRKIVIFLLTEKRANHFTISNAVELSPSTVSWHLNKLLESGVVIREKQGRESIFHVANPETSAQLLIRHKKSFLDEFVDNFVEIWEELAPPTA